MKKLLSISKWGAIGFVIALNLLSAILCFIGAITPTKATNIFYGFLNFLWIFNLGFCEWKDRRFRKQMESLNNEIDQKLLYMSRPKVITTSPREVN